MFENEASALKDWALEGGDVIGRRTIGIFHVIVFFIG